MGLGCWLALQGEVSAQAQLVLNNNAWLRIDNGAWVVLENPATSALQTIGTGGNIRSEGEFNRIRWQIRNSTGIYTVPFTTANGVKMPLTYQVTTAGSNDATASICFSTFNYGAIGPLNWNNDTYRPSDVSHMNNYWLGAALPNSDNVVDRFWEIDPGATGFAYTTKPSIRLGFTYDPGLATGDVRSGNLINGTSVVGAQRFNSPLNKWGDYWPAGVFALGATNTVTSVNVAPADFFRSWTLSNILEPLPVELVRSAAECADGNVVISWTTASETRSHYFLVERSTDGMVFDTIGELPAAGESQAMRDYSFTDEDPRPTAYYRIREVDLDGGGTIGPLMVSNCSVQDGTWIVTAWVVGDELHVLIDAADNEVHAVRLFDTTGKVVWDANEVPLVKGNNTMSISTQGIAFGVYTLRFDGPDGPMTRRVLLN